MYGIDESNESFRLQVLDPDVRIGLFLCLMARLDVLPAGRQGL